MPADKTHILIFEGTPYPCVISSRDTSAASVRVLNGGAYKVLNNRKINITASCDTLPAYYETGTKTILIDNPTSQIIQSVDSDKVVFNGNTAQLQNLDTSNIIVSGIATNAPYGFLRKVKAIQHSGNSYIITTGDVPMETAFKDFFFEYSQPYANGDTSLQRARSTADAGSFPVDLTYQFSANVSASGLLTVKPSLTVLLDISNFHLNYAKIEGRFDRVANMGLSISGAANASSEVTVFEKQLKPFYIPYTPFVVVPVLKVKLGSEASTDVSYNASITNTSSVNAYLEYTNDSWHNGYGRNTSTEYNFSGVNGNVNVELYVEPAIDVKLYNQDWAKGTIKAQVYVAGEAKTQPKPSCKLWVGVTAGVAANLEMFGINFLDVNYPEIFKYEKVLYECFKPKVITLPFTNTQCDTTIIAKGNVIDSGSSRIITEGFCWSTTPDPKITDNKKERLVTTTEPTKGLGFYNDTLSNLEPAKIYYAKAYAINKTDTAFGDVFSFKSPTAPDSTFVDSRDGQTYRFKHIGSQVWMTENLRYYSSNMISPNYLDNLLYGNLYFFYGGITDEKSLLLSLAPPGWHIPSDEEWTQLSNYLGGENIAGGKMKDSCSGLWIAPNIGASNTIGFSALPAGVVAGDGLPIGRGFVGAWWTSTPLNPSLSRTELWIRTINNDQIELTRLNKDYSYLSIRCVKN